MSISMPKRNWPQPQRDKPSVDKDVRLLNMVAKKASLRKPLVVFQNLSRSPYMKPPVLMELSWNPKPETPRTNTGWSYVGIPGTAPTSLLLMPLLSSSSDHELSGDMVPYCGNVTNRETYAMNSYEQSRLPAVLRGRALLTIRRSTPRRPQCLFAELDLNTLLPACSSRSINASRAAKKIFTQGSLRNLLSPENDEEHLLALSTTAERLHMENGILSNPSHEQYSSVSGPSHVYAVVVFSSPYHIRYLCKAVNGLWAYPGTRALFPLIRGQRAVPRVIPNEAGM
ncbi:uncharacterized protein BT62DRAFT_1012031 [Guyanagaster necrorhizus]|uniref:Uncharacterized protein n=1 Tax=Guyanagaster necrorhizus TaxID=856835 RepID=A0A9P8AMQ7_9AGAR|nr:uncharacterized protein BT62DRAFT_1012031 [Guyanagaster necrorhizus MCA 3950]KAG7441004.1 hypothetical protein BT62DRAFT_1012031 [Guyanagaster necrorhizus MCA 3950]